MADSNSPPKTPLKQWVIAIIIVLTFLNFQHNNNLLSTNYNPAHHYNNNYNSHTDNKGTNTDHFIKSTKPHPVPTLTLIDPHFLGGFRNQHMRFVAFVNYAVTRNISQILLPSIKWGDTYTKCNSISHEYLFDVTYWNERAGEKGLPRLVRYEYNVLEGGEACFNTTSQLWVDFNEEVLRGYDTNLRHVDTNADVKRSRPVHCRGVYAGHGGNAPANMTHLVPLGAGKGSGKFWNDYFKLQPSHGSIENERAEIEQSIFQLLRPSPAMHLAMERAIHDAIMNRTGVSSNHVSKLMALHPRVEQEMMTHKCSVFHEQNLTRVFERIGAFPDFSTMNNNITNETRPLRLNFDLIFVAVSAYQVEKPPRDDPRALPLQNIMIGNKEALIHARHHGVYGVPIFESGASTAKQVRFTKISPNTHETAPFTAQSLGVVELVASVINFFTSVSADVYVGVRGSSFSTDVFAVRHYMNKDIAVLHGGNYIVGPDGVEELVGPPKVHNC